MIEGQNNGDSAPALTVDSAASVLEGLFSDNSEETQSETHPDDKTPAAQSSTEEEQGDEPEASEDQSEESDEEESEPSDKDDDDESGDDDEQPIQTHRVKIDGVEKEVTLDELLKGYSRTEDYTRKTQKLADERRQIEAELTPERDAVRVERQRYAAQLSELDTALRSLVQEPDWAKLRAENPEQFADVWAAWDQHQRRLAVITEERQQADAQVQQDFAVAEKARLNTERSKLLEAIPAWTDKATAKKESDDIIAYGKTLGFSEEEVKGVTDHRALVAFRKAMLYDRAESDKVTAKQKAQVKIDKVKVAAPGANGPRAKVTDVTKAKQRHSRLGSVDSAASALELMLGD